MNFHLHIPYHTRPMLEEVPDQPWLTKHCLPDLKTANPWCQDNCFGEGRLFLASGVEHPVWADYCGALNARSHHKYATDNFQWEKIPKALDEIAPNEVRCPWPTVNGWSDNWMDYTESVHPGMGRLVAHACNHLHVELISEGPSLWANDFVCHREVWDGWLAFWRAGFHYLHGRFGNDPPFACGDQYKHRKPALLYERLTTAYFASRTDLKIVKLRCGK